MTSSHHQQRGIFLGGFETCSPEGLFHHLLLDHPWPQHPQPPGDPAGWGQDWGVSQPAPDPARPRPFTTAGEALSFAGIFSSARHMAGVRGVPRFGKAKRSPCRVPVLGGRRRLRERLPRSPGTRCFTSLRVSTAELGVDAGEEEEEGPAGARAACSRDTCRAPGRALLHGDFAAFSLGLCASTSFLPCAKLSSSQTSADRLDSGPQGSCPQQRSFPAGPVSQPARLVPYGDASSSTLATGSRAAVMPGQGPGSCVHLARGSGRDRAQPQHRSAADASALSSCGAPPGSR